MSMIWDKNNDFAKWYTSLIIESDLIEYGLVKGTIIFKPYAWTIWTNIQKGLDKYLKKVGTKNCSFPMMIPYSEFKKESNHIEGFAPELFKISKIGDKEIEDELVIRPTSEIAFCHFFASQSKSYNDLPLILNQWCSAFRVEKNTRPFLRNCEFQWQEQHAIFSTKDEAKDFSMKMINIYKDFINKYLCIPVLMGEKTEYERFAGAKKTYTVEALMQDGQALQCGTSHYLAQNFSKNFDIKFQTKDNRFEHVFQTSAGTSTRLIGATILAHSDEKGLVLPSMIAPWKYVIVINNSKDLKINDFLSKLKHSMGSIIFKVDDRDKSLGSRLSEYEIKGVPFQIIIGQKEIDENSITIFRRFTGEKYSISIEHLNFNYFKSLLEMHDNNLYTRANDFLQNSIVKAENLDEFIWAIKNKKIVLSYWAGNQEDEKKLKELTGASSRCISWDHEDVNQNENYKCFFTGKENAKLVYFARAY